MNRPIWQIINYSRVVGIPSYLHVIFATFCTSPTWVELHICCILPATCTMCVYLISQRGRLLICTASFLHDVVKISTTSHRRSRPATELTKYRFSTTPLDSITLVRAVVLQLIRESMKTASGGRLTSSPGQNGWPTWRR